LDTFKECPAQDYHKWLLTLKFMATAHLADHAKDGLNAFLTDLKRVNVATITEATRLAKDRKQWQDIMKQMAPLNQTLE